MGELDSARLFRLLPYDRRDGWSSRFSIHGFFHLTVRKEA